MFRNIITSVSHFSANLLVIHIVERCIINNIGRIMNISGGNSEQSQAFMSCNVLSEHMADVTSVIAPKDL